MRRLERIHGMAYDLDTTLHVLGIVRTLVLSKKATANRPRYTWIGFVLRSKLPNETLQ